MKYIENNMAFETMEVRTKTQLATVTTYVCPAYQTVLGYSQADQVVRARYLDYEGNPVDFNGEIIFEFEGEQQTIQAVNGIATLPFEIVDAGTYVVRTVNENVENGEVTINV